MLDYLNDCSADQFAELKFKFYRPDLYQKMHEVKAKLTPP